ncbi:MAG: hypothetical protein JNK85_05520 [Verrucomicrobiales bacterium]|nr:hypothetical protein [Verrucomicrobiales bacterium]
MKLSEAQAAKIVRRITERVRLYAWVFELVPAKKNQRATTPLGDPEGPFPVQTCNETAIPDPERT